jgi:hypothetical protein
VSKEDLQLEELLGQGNLGGPEYDRILGKVLARTQPRAKKRAAWFLVPAAGVSLALAAWVLYVHPRGEQVTPKGAAGGASAAVTIGCGPSASRVCAVGDTLMFEVNAAVASGYLGAYAERVDAPGGERIWYFPSASGSAPRIDSGAGTAVAPQGIRLGPEHAPGTYRVSVWLSTRPLQRTEVDGADAATMRSRASFELVVVAR